MSDVAKAIAESAASVAQKQADSAAHAQSMGLDLTTGKPITPDTVRGNVIKPEVNIGGLPPPTNPSYSKEGEVGRGTGTRPTK